MNKNRLEAFSDGVIAIIITIMVLEIKVPHHADVAALMALLPKFLSYILSFIYVGIYWNNHHLLIHTVKKVSGSMLWANLHLLFWLSLIPFSSGLMGENEFSALTTALYGFNLLLCAMAYFILQGVIINTHGEDSVLKRAIGGDWKGKTSLALYVSALGASYFFSSLSMVIYAIVAILWLIPDKRIEQAILQHQEDLNH